jgi:predicted DNA-binding protein with PD1-like motif
MKSFRGGTAAELIPFRLDDGEDLVLTLARTAEELNLGTAALTLGSGTLAVSRLVAAGAAGPTPIGIVTEHHGPLAIVSMQGWILANQPELQITLSRGAELIAGRALDGCQVQGGVEGLLIRLGNIRLGRTSDPQTGAWSLTTGAAPQQAPRIELLGQVIDPQAVLKVPAHLLQRYRVLPIAIHGDTLLVATANPRDLFAHDDLRVVTGMRIQWVDTPGSALEAALEQLLRWLQ